VELPADARQHRRISHRRLILPHSAVTSARRKSFSRLPEAHSVAPFLGQWYRHYPVPGAPALLAQFREEFDKHKEFMLAPAVHRDDGKLYMEPTLGIVKNTVLFR
jgi:hypothetical protein